MVRRRLDALEAEIRETRARLAALLIRADREYGLRAGLRAVLRSLENPAGDARQGPAIMRGLTLPAAILAFIAGIVGARRPRPQQSSETPAVPPQGDNV